MSATSSVSFHAPGLLHDHLDGSAAMVPVMPELYRLAGKTQLPDGSPIPADLDGWCAFFGNPMGDIVAKFGAVTSVLQSHEALREAASRYVAHRRLVDNVCYLEAKFAPQYHTAGGLSMKQVVSTVSDALVSAGQRWGVLVLPVVCIGREAEPDLGVEIAKLALDNHYECALDMACFEPAFPPERHVRAYQLTKGRIKREAHAGEWVDPEPAATYRQRLIANVRTAVFELEVDGVGHAWPLVDDLDNGEYIIEEMLARGIRVTSCPASYLQLGFIRRAEELGLDRLLERGLKLTVNPDDDLFLPPQAEVERLMASPRSGLRERHLAMLRDNVRLSAFHGQADRWLRRQGRE